MVSNTRDMKFADRNVSVARFQVSDLSTVKVNTGDEQYVQVADRTTGAAKPGVSVSLRNTDRNDKPRQVASRTTDQEGTFKLPGGERYRRYQLVLTDPHQRRSPWLPIPTTTTTAKTGRPGNATRPYSPTAPSTALGKPYTSTASATEKITTSCPVS